MLKKCYGLFLGLLVVTGSACVTPTHASSASIVITNIRAGSQLSAADEGVVLYNNTSVEIDVTNWCLSNKLQVKFACFIPSSAYKTLSIPGYGYATLVSNKVIATANQPQYSVVYEASASSSGSIVASSDSISLINNDESIVDQFTWSSSISSSQQWSRTKLSLLPDLFIDTDTSIDWYKTVFIEYPASNIKVIDVPHEDPVEEPPEEPIEEPINVPPIVSDSEATLPAIITELLPNAAGIDTGNEFIEIFNPNKTENISLKGYVLAIGPSLEKQYVLEEYILKPAEYKIFTNSELGYSLLNTSSRATLFMPNGDIASEVPAYTSPGDGEAWAFVNGVWQYTNAPTPALPNTANTIKSEKTSATSTATIKPCAANQYRSAETNRCRLVSTSGQAAPTPCKTGQERNTETNRCRLIATPSISTCKEGQEKNPETNRCRNIKKLTTAHYGIKKATEQQQAGMGWYMWAAIGGIVLLILGYGVWEWRDELGSFMHKLKAKFAPTRN
jgi:hypothetical protein